MAQRLQELELGGEIASERVVYKQSYIRKDSTRSFLFITRREGKMFSVWISNQENVIKKIKKHPGFKACVIYCWNRIKNELILDFKSDQIY